MRIALLASGSRGDIQPLLAVADALRERGHRVRMTVNTNLAAWAERTSLDIVPVEPDSEGVLKSEEGRALLATGKLVRLFRSMAEQAGLEVLTATGAYSFLVPPAAVLGVIERGKHKSDVGRNETGLGGILPKLAAAERRLLRTRSIPFGLSAIVIARRPGRAR